MEFVRFQDPTNRCLTPESLALGAQLLLAECEDEASEQGFMVVETRIQLRNRPELCATMSGPPVELGRMMILDKCQPNWDAQDVVGLCIIGYTPQPNTLAFVGACTQSADGQMPLGMSGASLFCWMVVTPNTGEVALQDMQKEKKLGIFVCDRHKVYEGRSVAYVQEDDGEFAANSRVFLQIWQKVFDERLYRSQDWTVKVDPDTVWSPDRLQGRLMRLGLHAGEVAYVKNTHLVFGFLGPIEIISRGAVDRLGIGYSKCLSQTSGKAIPEEDVFVQDCLEWLKVPAKVDEDILQGSGQEYDCWDHKYVAFHPFKDPGSWRRCAKAQE